MSKLTRGEVDNLRKAFDLFDEGKTGRVPAELLKSSLLNLSRKGEATTDPHTLYKVLLQLDKHRERGLAFEDFVEVFASATSGFLKGEVITREEATRLFRLLDPESRGKIGFRELRSLADDVGENLSADEIQEMIQRADLDNDGLIGPEEFYRILASRHTNLQMNV